jgi:hypothetical protein
LSLYAKELIRELHLAKLALHPASSEIVVRT